MKLFVSTILITLVSLPQYDTKVLKNQESFKIYVFKNRYDYSGRKYIEEHDIFTEIKLLGGYMLDPKKEGTIDLSEAEKHIVKLFPDRQQNGVLCINLENQLYKILRDSEKSSKEFQIAASKFSALFSLIRELRPNIKFGVYGLPFRTYYQSQENWNADCKLDAVLKLTDIIFPSLYILFTDREIGAQANNLYFRQNLNVAFDYGKRLEKPVVPFVWYIVNPGNRNFGGELLELEEFVRYINFIRNYRTDATQKVHGVVWWESSRAFFNKNVRLPGRMKEEGTALSNSEILIKFTKSLSYF